jgi:hypothetical protein
MSFDWQAAISQSGIPAITSSGKNTRVRHRERGFVTSCGFPMVFVSDQVWWCGGPEIKPLDAREFVLQFPHETSCRVDACQFFRNLPADRGTDS